LSHKPKSHSIAATQVKYLCDLAKLTIVPSEEERLRSELSSILDYFGILDSVPARGALESRGTPPGALRPDVPRTTEPDPILNGAPQRKGRWVRAPKVF
jgi:aspartyl/glutamyl-tRNA(Asn/Gln) amidotransferase C subunit